MLEKLAPYAVEGMKSTDDGRGGKAADLYCGVGLFAALLSPFFRQIAAVESNTESLSYAARNLQGARAEGRCELFALPVETGIDSPAAKAAFDAILVDPPRSGLPRKVSEFLARAKTPRLVYVSCNPVTLARDLSLLVSGGYGIADMRLFDFFPQTSHVESVARLQWNG